MDDLDEPREAADRRSLRAPAVIVAVILVVAAAGGFFWFSKSDLCHGCQSPPPLAGVLYLSPPVTTHDASGYSYQVAVRGVNGSLALSAVVVQVFTPSGGALSNLSTVSLIVTSPANPSFGPIPFSPAGALLTSTSSVPFAAGMVMNVSIGGANLSGWAMGLQLASNASGMIILYFTYLAVYAASVRIQSQMAL